MEENNVTGKVEFRMLRDHQAHALCSVPLFKRIWMLGFKACIDVLIVELRACNLHDGADLLAKVREASWPT